MTKALDVLTRDIAILLYLCIGWAVPILRGGRFEALIREDNLASLAVLVLVWMGYYALHYIQTGDATPPAPAAASRLSVSDLSAIMDSVTHHMQAVSVADCQRISTAVVLALTPLIRPPLPQAPPAAPPAATVP